jgi:hypothetical protein
MTLNVGPAIQIAAMMAEIESSMAQTGVDMDDPVHQTYINAQLELNSPDCNHLFVHNILATALHKPVITKH